MFVWDNAQNKQAFFFLHDDGPNLIKQHFYLITLDSITHSDTRFSVPGYALIYLLEFESYSTTLQPVLSVIKWSACCWN